jgi:hypothetical protein
MIGTAAMAGHLALPVPFMAKSRRPATMGSDKMDAERFVEDCVAANTGAGAQAAVMEVLARKELQS